MRCLWERRRGRRRLELCLFFRGHVRRGLKVKSAIAWSKWKGLSFMWISRGRPVCQDRDASRRATRRNIRVPSTGHHGRLIGALEMAQTRARLQQMATSHIRITSPSGSTTRLHLQKSRQEDSRPVAHLTHLYFVPQILADPAPGYRGRGERPRGIKTRRSYLRN